jgi:hypothetical protein
MSVMVDRLARAIRDELRCQSALNISPPVAARLAEAALQAMTDPTDAMRISAQAVTHGDVGLAWQAMITEALR